MSCLNAHTHGLRYGGLFTSEAAQRSRILLRLLVGALLLVAGAASLQAQIPQKASNEIRVHYLNVGAGSCYLVECPGDTAPIVVDCGSKSRKGDDLTSSAVQAYAQDILNRYADAPLLLVSHADKDHYNLLPEALGTVRPAVIYLGGRRVNYDVDGFDDWLDSQENQGITIRAETDFPEGYSSAGGPEAELACGSASTYIMTVNNGSSSNDRSMVVRIEHGNHSFVFTGDSTGKTEAAALGFPRTEATILTGSHHGAWTHKSNHLEWARATKPAVTIFSAGNQHKHPMCKAMLTYKHSLIDSKPHAIRCGKLLGLYSRVFPVEKAEYVTKISGTIMATSDGNDLSIDCSLQAACGL